jgi:hypothetical protein
VGNLDRDLAATAIDAHARGWTANPSAGVGVDETGHHSRSGRVDGQEQVGRRLHVGAVGKPEFMTGRPPMAIDNATSAGFSSVLRVTRKAVARASGLTRNSTRSAASLA